VYYYFVIIIIILCENKTYFQKVETSAPRRHLSRHAKEVLTYRRPDGIPEYIRPPHWILRWHTTYGTTCTEWAKK